MSQYHKWIASVRDEDRGKPHAPAGWTEQVAYAVRALYDGTADEGQQKLAMAWIEYVAGVGDFTDMSFRPGGHEGDRATAFAEGKRFVGLQIRKMLSPVVTEAIERAREREAAAANKRGAR